MTLVAPPSAVVEVELRAVLKEEAPEVREAVKVRMSRVGEAILMVRTQDPAPFGAKRKEEKPVRGRKRKLEEVAEFTSIYPVE